MDIDFLKSSPCEDQMEMMLLMQMENEMPMLDYSPQLSDNSSNNNNDNNNNTDRRNNFFEIIDHHNSPSTFNVSRSTQIVHQVSSITLPFLDNSSTSGTNRKYRRSPIGADCKIRSNAHSGFSSNFSPTTQEQVFSASYLTFPSRTMKRNNMGSMREMIFRIAAMQPIQIDPASVKAPKRRNVKISNDPQSVAARHRRERISEKIRILQRLVPGGTKMDTASMLDEAIHYMKFLKKQVQSLEKVEVTRPIVAANSGCLGFPVPMSINGNYYPYHQSVQH